MTKRRIARSATSVFLSLALVLTGIMPGVPFVKTAYAAEETVTITPGSDENKTGTGEMKISLKIKGEITPTVTLEGWSYGGTANSPVLGAGSNPGNGEVVYEYKEKDADDSTYSKAVPTAQGDYTVRATVSETDDYKSGTATADFTIGPMTKSMTITLVIHGHSFSYSAEGAKITAACSGAGGCDLTDKKVALTLKAPEKKLDTDSKSAAAAIEGLETFNNATKLSVSESQIEYYKGSTRLDAAPMEKGDYTAKLTVEGKTASVDYSIGTTTKTGSMTITLVIKAPATVKTAPAARELSYTGEAQELVTAGVAENGTMQYKLGADGTYSSAVPKAKDVGSYTVYYKAVSEDGGNDSAEASVSVTIAKASPAAPADITPTGTTWKGAKDGKITGINDTMEYSTDGGNTYTAVPNGTTEFTGLSGAAYLFRYKETDTAFASAVAEVNVPEGAEDKTAPTGEIRIDTNKWTSFLNTITFGSFFKETKEVTVTAGDDLSGVEKAEYYVSDQALTLEQVKAVTEWKAYASAFKLNPEKKYVVYARLTDKAGNTGYISSDGLVFVNLPVGYVTDIDTDSAKLNMKLSDSVRSEIRAAGFEYKKKADADTAWTKVAANSVAETVTKEISSLTAGTDYVFRPYVTYTNDTTDTGAEKGFTTDTKPATVKTAPAAKELSYTGEAQELVTAGVAENGTMQYKLGADGTYSTAIPKAKDVGTYTVYYKAVSEDGGNDSAEASVSVTIAKASPAAPADITPTGTTWKGAKDGKITGINDTMEYSTDGGNTYTAVPNGTTEFTGLSGAAYLFRYKETDTAFASAAAEVNVPEGAEDKTAPTGEIRIDTDKWTSFLNTITFGSFFKETKEVTVTAGDDLSDVEKIEYYVSDQALTLEQVKAVTEWNAYSSAFKLNPEKKYVVYARLTDKAGNTGYISSDGLVFVNLPVGYVTDIGVDSAKLNMKLSDSVRTEIKAAGFEYKKKADADTAWTKVAANSVAETVTKKISSLTAGTDYVFRPYVTYTNDSTDTGAEQNFTTDTKPAVTGSIDVKVKNETDDNKDVVVTIEEGNNVLASQEYNGIAKGAEVTTGKFKELPDGTYNIVIKSKDGEFVETKMITIANGAAETISFTISKGEMKTDVEVGADTPKVAVDGLSKEELVQYGTITSDEKTKVESGDISLEVTLKAEKKETSKVETKTVSAIQQVMAESSTKLVVDMFLDLSLFKTVTQLTGDQAGKTDETDIGSTNTKVLEIAVPYDTTIRGLVVYRYHGSVATALKKLSSAPSKGTYEDGSFYLSGKYIHIFASGFSTYAIAKEESSSGGGGGTTPVTPGKTTPAKPSAPTLDSKTETSITVKTVAGQEYSIDGGKTWQTSGTFTGLTPETEYSIVTKITTTSTANESPVSDALKVTTDKKADSSTPTPTDKPTETPGATSSPADKITKAEKAKAKLSLNAGLKVRYVGKKVTVKWGKVSKADRYVVYAAYCGPDKCTKIRTLSGSKTSMTFTKLNGSKLNLKKNVKVYVVAYRKVNGKETKLAKSITAHVVGTKNAKYTNVKKIKLSKSSYTLKVNKTTTIKAEIVLEDKKKKQLSDGHAPEFRYASSNTEVATVDKNGKIKAVGKGTCYIYVYAKNGYAKKIKVTVK